MVVPGEFLCYEEEALPGEGVYVENGRIFASVFGRKIYEDNVVSVLGKNRILSGLERGSLVFGYVRSFNGKKAKVQIFPILKEHSRQMPLKMFELNDSGVKFGDIIIAKVIGNNRLSIRDFKLGVIIARCSVCNHFLKKHKNYLICPYCNNKEKRKVSSLYDKVIEWAKLL